MDEEYFWNQMESEHGSINVNIRNILKIQNLCSQSLSRLTAEGIQRIESDMREMAESLREQAAAGGIPLEEIYGLTYASQPEQFKFFSGDVLCLLDLADLMKRKGIKFFLNKKQNQQNTTASIELIDETAEQHFRALHTKIMHFFTSQGITDPSYDVLLEQLKMIEIKVFTDGCGKLRAEALCPMCQANGKRSKHAFSLDDRGTWHIFSLTRHSKTAHFKLPESKKRRRAVTKAPPDEVAYNSEEEMASQMENVSTSTASPHSDSTLYDPLYLNLHQEEL